MRLLVGEGGQGGVTWAIDIWEVPVEVEGLGQVADDGLALGWKLL